MPDKRFLGLGFSFAATDKGLEKKLKSVSSVLDDISETLNSISHNAATAGSAIGRIKAPSASSASGRRKTTTTTRRLSFPMKGGKGDCCDKILAFLKKSGRDQIVPRYGRPIARSRIPASQQSDQAIQPRGRRLYRSRHFDELADSVDDLFGSIGDLKQEKKFSKLSEAFLADFSKVTNPKIYQSFIGSISELGVVIGKNGDLTKASQEKITKAFVQTLKASSLMDSFGFSLEKVSIALKAAGEWAKDVLSSFKNFGETIGLNLEKMIPPQVFAAFGVLKSIAKAPLKIGKSIFDKAKEKIEKKWRVNVLQSLGKGDNQKNMVKLLDRVVEELEPKKDKGFFGKALDWIKKLLTSPLSLLAEAALLLLKPWKILTPLISSVGKAFRFLWGLISDTGFGEALAEIGTAIADVLGAIEAPAIAAGLAIAAIGLALSGFAKGVYEDWEKWKSVFSRIGNAIANIVKAFVDSSPILSGVFSFMKDSISSAVNDVVGAFKKLGEWISDFVKYVWDKITGIFDFGKNMEKKVLGAFEGAADWLEGKSKSSASSALPRSNTTDDLFMKNSSNKALDLQQGLFELNKENSSKMDDQINLQKDQNDLMQKLIDHLEGKKEEPRQNPPFNFNFDAKKFGISVDQSNLAEAAAGGI